jgi:diguanylate cyclase (GGDEF)-like protein/PAS domain S-box-containing protein
MRKILIVEDDFSLAQVLKNAVETYIDSCEILFASDGEKAMDMIRFHKPNVVVLDIYIPKTNGFEVLQLIQQDDTCADVAFVLMSGKYTARNLQIINQKLRAQKVLHKPFEVMDFIRAVKSLLPEIQTDSDLVAELRRLQGVVQKKDQELMSMKSAWNELLTTTNDGVWDWDLRTQTIEFSTKFKDIIGVAKENKLSLPSKLTALIHPDDTIMISERLKAYTNKEIPRFCAETQLRCAGGKYKWVEISAKALWNEYGNAYRLIGRITDISDRKMLEERLAKMAYHDSLTQLPNEELLYDRAKQVFATAQRFDQQIGIVYLNMDDLNIINKSAGNFVGDTLLRQSSIRMLNVVRNIDTVARVGGDEFVILLPNIKKRKNAEIVAHRIKDKISKEFHIGKKKFTLTASFGLAFYPFPANSFVACLKMAKKAMVKAKLNGKNQIQIVYKPEQLDGIEGNE